ncbi:MAG: hypothetical protein O7C56_08160 [Rickettsia endosymbiont of Ixodes persulcatus]|nr:hypothetical protein [Rickettsia endosymbiont of Ixodes persulcatus]
MQSLRVLAQEIGLLHSSPPPPPHTHKHTTHTNTNTHTQTQYTHTHHAHTHSHTQTHTQYTHNTHTHTQYTHTHTHTHTQTLTRAHVNRIARAVGITCLGTYSRLQKKVGHRSTGPNAPLRILTALRRSQEPSFAQAHSFLPSVVFFTLFLPTSTR